MEKERTIRWKCKQCGFKSLDNPMRKPEVAQKLSKVLSGRPSDKKGKTYSE